MLAFLPASIRAALAALLVVLNTVTWFVPLFIVALLKLLVPLPAWQRGARRLLHGMAEGWISVNNGVIALTQRIDWRVELPAGLSVDASWLVIANHQSWADIVVLQRVFNRRIPFLKFFLKRELAWVPLLGVAWWALEMPFMRRYSREYLEQHPHKRGTDLDITRRACERFRDTPVSIMSFVEGTRFRDGRHAAQESPYRHLLRPKAGGVAFALNAMDGAIRNMLDVTIVYAPHRADFADLFMGRVRRVHVHVRKLPVPERFLHGDYQQDERWREDFQAWLRTLWEEKDRRIDALLADSGD